MDSTEGFISLHHNSFPDGFNSQTWYKIVGDRRSQRRPLIVLHGGPGFTHNYLKPTFEQFASRTSTPVIFYDQIGNGNSTHLPERRLDEAFWTPDLFVAELENLVTTLDLAEGFFLYGHSWGAMLALRYVATCQPAGLQKLILGSGPASMSLWKSAARSWITSLPPKQAALLGHYEFANSQDDPEVSRALADLNKITTLMEEPFPPELQQSLDWLDQDDTVVITANGPNDLCDGGSMKDLDVSDDCRLVQIPVLILSGDRDGATEGTILPLYEKLVDAKWKLLPGGHMVHLEKPDFYSDCISQYLYGTS